MEAKNAISNSEQIGVMPCSLYLHYAMVASMQHPIEFGMCHVVYERPCTMISVHVVCYFDHVL